MRYVLFTWHGSSNEDKGSTYIIYITHDVANSQKISLWYQPEICQRIQVDWKMGKKNEFLDNKFWKASSRQARRTTRRKTL